MSLMSDAEHRFVAAVSKLIHCNPFLPERITHEREALGDDYSPRDADWNVRNLMGEGLPANVVKLVERGDALADDLRARIARGASPTDAERGLYEDLTAFTLFYKYYAAFKEAISAHDSSGEPGRIAFYDEYCADAKRLLNVKGFDSVLRKDLPHLFACFFQIVRSFSNIFRGIVGSSRPVVRLRACVWQSIFTHDMRRYRRSLYGRMGDLTTLILGPTGTGKELVAQAIGRARYIPFDPKEKRFKEDYAGTFITLNLTALSPTLIESELFGHKRGAFTGAVQDRQGWLELCPALGTVFLDEIGEVDAAIQVKLLHVLQSRTFQRLGESKPRRFAGKVISATNCDLAAEIQAGRFREDFYYRLCSDVIVTPSLRERLADRPEERHDLVRYLAGRIAPEEADALTGDVERWIDRALGADYPWPGNVRELEQCVRNVLVRNEYRPAKGPPVGAGAQFLQSVSAGTLTADEVLRHYCSIVYAQTGSYEETARRLKLDRRTVKSKILPDLVEELRG